MIPLAVFMSLIIFRKRLISQIFAVVYILLSSHYAIYIFIGTWPELVISDWSAIRAPSYESQISFAILFFPLVIMVMFILISQFIQYIKKRTKDSLTLVLFMSALVSYAIGGYYMQKLSGWAYLFYSMLLAIGAMIAYLTIISLKKENKDIGIEFEDKNKKRYTY